MTSDVRPVTTASKAKKRPSKRGKTTADGERWKRATKLAPRKGKKSPTKSPPKSEKTKNITDNEVDQVIEDDEDDEALEEGLPAHSSPPMNQKKLTDLVSSRTLLSSGAPGSLSRASESLSPTRSILSVDELSIPVSPGLPPTMRYYSEPRVFLPTAGYGSTSPHPAHTRHAMLLLPIPLHVSVTNLVLESIFPVRPMLTKRRMKWKAPAVENDVDLFSSSPCAASPPHRLRQRRSQSKSPLKSPQKRNQTVWLGTGRN